MAMAREPGFGGGGLPFFKIFLIISVTSICRTVSFFSKAESCPHNDKQPAVMKRTTPMNRFILIEMMESCSYLTGPAINRIYLAESLSPGLVDVDLPTPTGIEITSCHAKFTCVPGVVLSISVNPWKYLIPMPMLLLSLLNL